MKTIITSICLLASMSLYAQFDVEVAITSITDGEILQPGDPLDIDIDITNHGAVLPQDDTLYIAWVLDGTFYGPNTGVLMGASVAGGGVTFPVPGAASFTSLSEGDHTICAWFVGIGSQLFGQNFDLSGVSNGMPLNGITISDVANGDANPLDNEHCINFTVEDTTTSGGGGGGGGVGLETNVLNSVRFFPNPANDIVTIEAPETGANVTVLNMLGQVVMEKEIVGTETMNVSTLPQGAYHVQLVSIETGDIGQKRLIIKR